MGQIGPFEAHAFGQILLEQLRDRFLRLSARIAGRGRAVQIGRIPRRELHFPAALDAAGLRGSPEGTGSEIPR
jgi:hypothetical protein